MTSDTTPAEKTEPIDAQFIDCDAGVIINQIGIGNLMAISGQVWTWRKTGVSLPVRYGYWVTIDLHASDTYVVRREFRRGGRTWLKGERTDVYCDEVGEVAYRASCYLDKF